MRYYHPLYKDYYCDEHGNIFSEKYFDNPRGYHYALNKQIDEVGYWCPKVNIDRDGYRRISINKYTKRANRFCYECYHNIILPTTTRFVVDHINHIRNDDSIYNLRYISQKENIDNEHRNKLVSEAIKRNRRNKNGSGDLEEYLSCPHTLAHFKRDISKRDRSFEDFDYIVFSKQKGRPIKYLFFEKI